MATDSVAFESLTDEDRTWAPAEVVVWGKPAARFAIVVDEVVSFLDLSRGSRDEDAGPLSLAFIKLVMLVLVGIAVTSIIGYALGAAIAHTFASFAG